MIDLVSVKIQGGNGTNQQVGVECTVSPSTSVCDYTIAVYSKYIILKVQKCGFLVLRWSIFLNCSVKFVYMYI